MVLHDAEKLELHKEQEGLQNNRDWAYKQYKQQKPHTVVCLSEVAACFDVLAAFCTITRLQQRRKSIRFTGLILYYLEKKIMIIRFN